MTPTQLTPETRLRAELIRRNATADDVLHLLLQSAPAEAADVLLAVYHEMTAPRLPEHDCDDDLPHDAADERAYRAERWDATYGEAVTK